MAAQRRAQHPHLLRAEQGSAPLQHLRRLDRRAHRQEQDVLLLQLRGRTAPHGHHRHVHGPAGRRGERRLLRSQRHRRARPRDARRRDAGHAVCRQRHPRVPHRPGGAGVRGALPGAERARRPDPRPLEQLPGQRVRQAHPGLPHRPRRPPARRERPSVRAPVLRYRAHREHRRLSDRRRRRPRQHEREPSRQLHRELAAHGAHQPDQRLQVHVRQPHAHQPRRRHRIGAQRTRQAAGRRGQGHGARDRGRTRRARPDAAPPHSGPDPHAPDHRRPLVAQGQPRREDRVRVALLGQQGRLPADERRFVRVHRAGDQQRRRLAAARLDRERQPPGDGPARDADRLLRRLRPGRLEGHVPLHAQPRPALGHGHAALGEEQPPERVRPDPGQPRVGHRRRDHLRRPRRRLEVRAQVRQEQLRPALRLRLAGGVEDRRARRVRDLV